MNDSTSNSVTVSLSWDAISDKALVQCSSCGRISTYSEFARSCGCFSDTYPIEVQRSAELLAPERKKEQ